MKLKQPRSKINAAYLDDYIEAHHKGNVTAYAKEYGTTRQQMDKWLDLGASVIDGVIHRPVAKHKK